MKYLLERVETGTSTVAGAVTNAGTLSVVNATATFNQRVVVTSGGSYSFRGATNVFATGLVVSANGFLGGSGRINSSVTVTNDGTLSPGNSPGTMTFSSNLTLLNNSLLVLEIGGTNPTDYDHLIVEGTLAKAGSVLVTNLGYIFVGGETFDFLDAANWAGSFSLLTLPTLTGGMTWNQSLFETQGILSVTAVPEPSTLGAAGAGLALLLFLRRRRCEQR